MRNSVCVNQSRCQPHAETSTPMNPIRTPNLKDPYNNSIRTSHEPYKETDRKPKSQAPTPPRILGAHGPRTTSATQESGMGFGTHGVKFWVRGSGLKSMLEFTASFPSFSLHTTLQAPKQTKAVNRSSHNPKATTFQTPKPSQTQHAAQL